MEITKTLKSCRICGSEKLTSVVDLGNQPLANDLSEEGENKKVKIPLVLCWCSECGTIQLTETVDPEILFKQYVWVTGTSQTARNYAEVFKDRALKRIKTEKPFVVEIASNDGTFLRPFKNEGCRIIGIDPAENIAREADKKGIKTISEYFGEKVATELKQKEGGSDFIFARNVIPHVANAKDVISGIQLMMKDQSIGAIEFHRADTILKELHYDSVYHEHLYYHSIKSMEALLDNAGLKVYDIETSPISGGSYVIYFAKEEREKSVRLKQCKKEEEESGVNKREKWEEFDKRCKEHKKHLLAILNKYKQEGKSLIGYGASARSSTLLNYCGIDSNMLEAVIDKSVYKHNKYTPGTNIKIISPDKLKDINPEVILLLAWNFEREITEELIERGWKGTIISPLPNKIEVKIIS